MNITTLETLREQYADPKERAVRKEIRALDVHCRRFIGLSPFLILATSDKNHDMDASPRGGPPGFVKVTADGAILIPDAPGNNRLDSFANIISTGKVGLLLLIPGVDETLRVNGSAVLSRADADIALCTDERRAPKLVIRVAVEAAYLHCAKAFMRSKLWDPSAHVDRARVPNMSQMLRDHTGIEVPPETREEMMKRYAPDL